MVYHITLCYVILYLSTSCYITLDYDSRKTQRRPPRRRPGSTWPGRRRAEPAGTHIMRLDELRLHGFAENRQPPQKPPQEKQNELKVSKYDTTWAHITIWYGGRSLPALFASGRSTIRSSIAASITLLIHVAIIIIISISSSSSSTYRDLTTIVPPSITSNKEPLTTTISPTILSPTIIISWLLVWLIIIVTITIIIMCIVVVVVVVVVVDWAEPASRQRRPPAAGRGRGPWTARSTRSTTLCFVVCYYY